MKNAESVLYGAREQEEPVFVLRAQDKCAMTAMTAYLEACKLVECKKEHLNGVKEIVADFQVFAIRNTQKMKIPD